MPLVCFFRLHIALKTLSKTSLSRFHSSHQGGNPRFSNEGEPALQILPECVEPRVDESSRCFLAIKLSGIQAARRLNL